MDSKAPTTRQQRTLKAPAEFQGVGLHNGAEVKVVVRPADVGNGVTFVRTDLEDQPEVRAICSNLKNRDRHSVLADGPARVHTVEHLLSALWALRIDNARVDIDGDEVPGLDGSARDFVAGLNAVGSVDQKAESPRFILKEPLYVQDGAATLVALPNHGGLTLEYHLDYASGNGLNGLSRQSVFIDLTPESFEKEIASARTFVFEDEVEKLREAGFGRGASYENTLVVCGDSVRENKLRFDDELARHKVLDLVGDLATLGADLEAH
ncbi:MAG: UDP-3-O-acyl-N-acetylglucosamine deacetylase, partial [Planctomycetota bacterium]